MKPFADEVDDKEILKIVEIKGNISNSESNVAETNRELDMYNEDDIGFSNQEKPEYTMKKDKGSISGGDQEKGRGVKGPVRRGKDLCWRVVKVLGSNKEWLASGIKQELEDGQFSLRRTLETRRGDNERY